MEQRLPKLTKNILEIPPDIVFEIVVSYEPNVEYKMKAYKEIGVLKQLLKLLKERKFCFQGFLCFKISELCF
jgi:Uma2 family endonuclease